MGVGSRAGRPGRVVEVGVRGQARYARMESGETIWWGSEEEVPDAVALAADATRAEIGRRSSPETRRASA